VLANQGQARTVLWKMAYKGVEEKPLLGWGQDSFGYIFAKYYDPAMYAQEQWFDRSHNVFLDWLVAAGVLGLLGYLLLFVFGLMCVFSKRARLTVIEKSILLGLLTAYFIHNLFVFDNLSSYVLFFLLLAYMHERYTYDAIHAHIDAHKKGSSQIDTGTLIIASGFVAVLLASYVGYKTIAQPYIQNHTLINAMTMSAQQGQVTKELYAKMKKTPADVALEDMKKVFSLGYTGQAEAFEQLNNVATALFSSETVSDTTKLGFFNLYQDRVTHNDAHIQGDPRYSFFTSAFYSKIGSYDKALEYAKKTYDLSPSKQSFAYQLAILELQKANINGALVYLKKAYEDAPQNPDAFGYYVSTLIEAARTSPTTFDTAKLTALAEVLATGYTKFGHTILVNDKLWELFTKTGKKIYARQLAARLIILVPEKKAEIEVFVK
jgi:tetratricopeptide (TPR) repeat protein